MIGNAARAFAWYYHLISQDETSSCSTGRMAQSMHNGQLGTLVKDENVYSSEMHNGQ
jgi:hypothetical protein